MLTFWTSSSFHQLKAATQPALKRQAGGPPKYRGVPFEPPDVPVPRKGEVVMAMGTKCMEMLQGLVLPKNLGLGKVRGKLWPAGEGQGHFMVTWSPNMMDQDPQVELDLTWDTHLACRYLRTGSLKPVIGKYEWVVSYEPLIREVEEQYARTGKPVLLTEDLETRDLWPWYSDNYVVTISFTKDIGTAQVMAFGEDEVPPPEILGQVRWLESTEKVSLCGANFKYDNIWKRVKWGLPFPENFTFDTLLGGGLLNENILNSLSNQVRVYVPELGGYDDELNEKHDKSRMDLALHGDPDGFLTYAGGDTDGCARVRPIIAQALRDDPALLDFYVTILHPAARAFERIEHRGLLVDSDALLSVGLQCEEEVAQCRDLMADLVPPAIKAKHAEKLNYTPRQLADLFFSPRGWDLSPKLLTKKAPVLTKDENEGKEETPAQFVDRVGWAGARQWVSTSIDDHLKWFKDHPQAGPFIGALRDMNKADKIRSSYVDGFLKHLRPDGRFHPTYGLYNGSIFEWARKGKEDHAGTNTGRTSAKNPHVQTIPKRGKWAKPLRSCFPAPPGFRFWECDYSQIELKIAACLADEDTMIQAYLDGMDLHLLTGCKSAGLQYQEGLALKGSDKTQYDRVRYGAKAENFGFVYGQSAQGFMGYAFKEWDLVYTLAECEKRRDDFFELYPKLLSWHSAYINWVYKDAMVRSPLGRVRHLPLIRSRDRQLQSQARRQAINSPVQSTASDLMLWSIAIAELDLNLADEGLLITGMTHDSAYGYVPEDRPDLVLRFVEVMENLPLEECFEWAPQLKFTAEAEIGPNWAELEELQLAA